MPARTLTEAVIKRLPIPEKTLDIRDANTRGLYLRVKPTGRKVWRLRYHFRDKARVLILGEWPTVKLAEARRAVFDAQDTIELGSDPAADAQKAKAERSRMPTVAEFADEYIERHAKRHKKTWKEDRRVLYRDVVPEIGKLRLDEVHRRDVVRIMDVINDRGATTAAKMMLAVTRKMFHFAIERGVLDATPVQHVKSPRVASRDVVLTDEALRHFWLATEPYNSSRAALPMHHCTRQALRLLLLTGQRSSEVAGIQLSEIELDKKRWVLPGSRTKNGLDQVVPLSPLAVEVVEKALETADDRYLFPTNSKTGHLTTWANVQAMERLFEGWEPRYRAHDLRRTVATRLGELGFNRLVVDKCLNHKDGSIGGIYDRHSYDREKRAALDSWADALIKIIADERGVSQKLAPKIEKRAQ